MSKSKKRNYRQGRSHKKAHKNNATTIGAIIMIIVAVALIAYAVQSSSAETGAANTKYAPTKGYAAPIFRTVVLSGGETGLQDYAGDVVVVNFWATWCPPCKAEMPGINAFYEAYQDEDLVVLAVNAGEDETTVRPFIEASRFTFPVLLDPAGKIVNLYRVRSFPTTLVIDRSGVIQYIHTGMISPEELKAVVTPLL